MVGTVDSERGNTEDLVAAVHEELLALRGAQGKLTVEKFSRYPNLRLVCGNGDALVAFLMFERELQRYVRQGKRNEVAAALSIAAPWETVLARLEEVLGHFDDAGRTDRNQRTARRWSDQGMLSIATELVHLADVQMRLGSDLITIELSGTYEDRISLEIYQLTTRHPKERAPLVRLWQYRDEDDANKDTTVEYDLDRIEFLEGNKGPFRLRLYSFKLDIPNDQSLSHVDVGKTVYRISIEGRDAPLRAVSFQDDSNLSDSLGVRFTAHLTDATVEIVKRALRT